MLGIARRSVQNYGRVRPTDDAATADGHEVARPHAFNFVVVSFRMSAELQDRSAHSILAFFIAWAAVICCSLPAIGETLALPYGQGPENSSKTPIIMVKILRARRRASKPVSRTHHPGRPARRTEKAGC